MSNKPRFYGYVRSASGEAVGKPKPYATEKGARNSAERRARKVLKSHYDTGALEILVVRYDGEDGIGDLMRQYFMHTEAVE